MSQHALHGRRPPLRSTLTKAAAALSLSVISTLSVSVRADTATDNVGDGIGLDTIFGAGTDDFVGRSTQSVQIAVPSYYGLEPRLNVGLTSTGSLHGLAGFGSSLGGWGSIERRGRRGGQPNYDANDTFWLDGGELVACSAIPSASTTVASCIAGGNYATKFESYQRIYRDTTNDRWTVWLPDGTKTEYFTTHRVRVASASPNQTYRWLISGATRPVPAGGTAPRVDYAWDCTTVAEECYPNEVSYGTGTDSTKFGRVTYGWEARNDRADYARGSDALGTVTRRLASITVRTAAQVSQVHQFRYDEMPGTLIPYLRFVQTYGTDGLAPTTRSLVRQYEWTLPPTGTAAFGSLAQLGTRTSTPSSGDDEVFADINGDGRQDYAYKIGSALRVMLANADGTFGSDTQWGTQPASPAPVSGLKWFADVTGDGRADFVYIAKNGAQYELWVQTATTSNTFSTPSAASLVLAGAPCIAAGAEQGAWAGDVNGDGKIDIAYAIGTAPSCTSIRVALATTAGAFADSGATPTAAAMYGGFNGETQPGWVWLKDVDDDGRADWVYGKRSTKEIWVKRSDVNGSVYSLGADEKWGTRAFTTYNNGACTSSVNSTDDAGADWIDVNGDGSLDFVYGVRCGFFSGTSTWISPASYVLPNLGKKLGDGATEYRFGFAGQRVLHDMNGDGLVDIHVVERLITANPNPHALWVGLGRGRSSGGDSGTVSSIPWATMNDTTPPPLVPTEVADTNGDRKGDFLWFSGTALWGYRSIGQMRPVVTRATAAGGGTTSFEYASSTTLTNSDNAVVTPIVTKTIVRDGISGSPDQTTNFNYDGGLFDFIERRFLGFHHVTTTRAPVGSEAVGARTETWYAQDYGSISKAQLVNRYEGKASVGAADVLLGSAEYSYWTNGSTLPYRSMVQWRRTSSYDPTTQYARTELVDYRDGAGGATYDLYGNLTSQIDQGSEQSTGDETRTVVAYTPRTFTQSGGVPTDPYLVALPARYTLTTTGGTPTTLNDVQIFYDGATTNVTPTAGYATRTVTWSSNASISDPIELMAYDSRGNMTSNTNAVGAASTVVYDPIYSVIPIESRNALYDPTPGVENNKQRVKFTINSACGAPDTVTDENNIVTTYQYDTQCRVTRISKPFGSETPYIATDHTPFGLYSDSSPQTCTSTCPGGGTCYAGICVVNPPGTQKKVIRSAAADSSGIEVSAEVYLDGLGHAWRSIRKNAVNPGGSSTTFTDSISDYRFDARGRLASQSLPYATGATPRWTTYSYDGIDRLTQALRPDATVQNTLFGADANGVFATTSDLASAGASTFLRKSTAYSRSRVYGFVRQYLTDTTWVTTTSSNSISSRTSTELDGLGNAVVRSYDSLGNVTQESDPNEANPRLFGFDASGRLTSARDPKNVLTQPSYDVLGRITRNVVGVGLAGVKTYDFRYDEPRGTFKNMGQQTSMVDDLGTTEWDYNTIGSAVRTTRTIDGTSYTMWTGVDAAGRVKGYQYPDGDIVGATPPQTNTPVAVGSGFTYTRSGLFYAAAGINTSTEYDAHRRAISIANANGTVSSSAYNQDRGWIDSISTTGPFGSIQNLGYSYDLAGRLTQTTGAQTFDNWTYNYDATDRLTRAVTGADVQTWTYDSGQRMLTNSRIAGSYTYGVGSGSGSGSGCWAGPHAVTAAGSKTYCYDAAGNLTQAGTTAITYDLRNNVSTVTGGNQYAYGASGRRLKATTATGTTHYPFGDSYEAPVSGTPSKNLGTAKRTGPVGSFQNTWLHDDVRNSVVASSTPTGAVGWRQNERPYGERLGTTQENVSFASQRYEPSTNLYFLNARYFDPVLSQFMSTDPKTTDGINRYAYARNNPIAFSDPNGTNAFFTSTDLANMRQGGGFLGGGPSLSDGSLSFMPIGPINWSALTNDVYRGPVISAPRVYSQFEIAVIEHDRKIAARLEWAQFFFDLLACLPAPTGNVGGSPMVRAPRPPMTRMPTIRTAPIIYNTSLRAPIATPIEPIAAIQRPTPEIAPKEVESVHLVLGLSADKGMTTFPLAKLHSHLIRNEKIPAKVYMDLVPEGMPGNLDDRLGIALDKATHFHFSIEGFSFREFRNWRMNPQRNVYGGVTSWELDQILYNPKYNKIPTFYYESTTSPVLNREQILDKVKSAP